MSAYYQFQQPTPVTPSMIPHATSHHARHRRAPRISVSQNTQHRQFRGVRSMKELAETTTPVLSSFRDKFEAGRSFDLEDDLEFIPGMLTETDLVSISGSDRSSVSSGGSCESSPLPHHQTIAQPFTLNSASAAFVSSFSTQQATLKLHQPSATRVRNAIPIINPATGSPMPNSPPATRNTSPNRLLQQQQQQQQQLQQQQQQAMLRRW
jgi:hypothetical protein